MNAKMLLSESWSVLVKTQYLRIWGAVIIRALRYVNAERYKYICYICKCVPSFLICYVVLFLRSVQSIFLDEYLHLCQKNFFFCAHLNVHKLIQRLKPTDRISHLGCGTVAFWPGRPPDLRVFHSIGSTEDVCRRLWAAV